MKALRLADLRHSPSMAEILLGFDSRGSDAVDDAQPIPGHFHPSCLATVNVGPPFNPPRVLWHWHICPRCRVRRECQGACARVWDGHPCSPS